MLPEPVAQLVREAGGEALLLDARRGRALLSATTNLSDICRGLRHAGFTRLVDFHGEHLGRTEDGADNFALRLNLRAPAHGHALLILKWKFRQDGAHPAHPTLSQIWPAAGLDEREIFELLGLPFAGNLDLSPLLLDEQFPGNPLRKDYHTPRGTGGPPVANGPVAGGDSAPPLQGFDAQAELQRRHEQGLLETLNLPVGAGHGPGPVAGGGSAPPRQEGGEQ